MFPPDSSQVVKALNVLCKVSEKLLLFHKTELLAIYDKLQFIQVVNSTAVTSVICMNTEPSIINHADWNLSSVIIHHLTYSNMHRPTTALLNHKYSSLITSHSNNPQPPHSVHNLVEELNKNLKEIEKTIEKTLCHGHQQSV